MDTFTPEQVLAMIERQAELDQKIRSLGMLDALEALENAVTLEEQEEAETFLAYLEERVDEICSLMPVSMLRGMIEAEEILS